MDVVFEWLEAAQRIRYSYYVFGTENRTYSLELSSPLEEYLGRPYKKDEVHYVNPLVNYHDLPNGAISEGTWVSRDLLPTSDPEIEGHELSITIVAEGKRQRLTTSFPIDHDFGSGNFDGLCAALNNRIRDLLNKSDIQGFKDRFDLTFTKYGDIVNHYVYDVHEIESSQSLVDVFKDNGMKLKWSTLNNESFKLIRSSTHLDVRGTLLTFLGLGHGRPSWNGYVTEGLTNQELKDICNLVDIYFQWDGTNQRVKCDLSILGKITLLSIELGPSLQQILKMDKIMDIGKNVRTKKPGERFPKPDDIYDWRNIGSSQASFSSKERLIFDDIYYESRYTMAHINCSLTDSTIIGGIQRPLLDIVPLQTSTYDNETHTKARGYNYEPINLKFRTLGISSFQSATFTLEDERGDPLPLDPKGVVTLTVRFKRDF